MHFKKSRYTQGKTKVTKKENGYFLDEAIVIYRSSYELKAIEILTKLYKVGRIKSWKYEVDVFRYESSVDASTHKYYMDFTLEMNDGRIFYVEVKPFHETQPPKKSKGGKGPSENQILTYIKNQDKWNTVKKYCEEQNKLVASKRYRFVIWTENELNITKQKHTQNYYKRKAIAKKNRS